MNIYGFPEGQIIAFALVFLRIIAFVIAWPVFGSATVPVPVKILLALVLSLTVYPTLDFKNAELLTAGEQVIFFAIRELLIGLILGFLMRLFFFAVSVAGELISISMSLSSAQIYNPAFGSQSNVVEQIQLTLATLFFLAINGHHLFLTGLTESFATLPVSGFGLNVDAFSSFAVLGQQVLVLGLKMAAPIIIAIFIANIAMGILGRAVPQINVLITSMPLTILAGVAVLFIMVPVFVEEMHMLLDLMSVEFFKAMRSL